MLRRWSAGTFGPFSSWWGWGGVSIFEGPTDAGGDCYFGDGVRRWEGDGEVLVVDGVRLGFGCGLGRIEFLGRWAFVAGLDRPGSNLRGALRRGEGRVVGCVRGGMIAIGTEMRGDRRQGYRHLSTE